MAGLFDLLKNANPMYDEYAKDKLAKRYTEQDIRDLNISQNPVYLQGVQQINPAYSSTKRGFYNPADPYAININPYGEVPLKTTGHEAYHLQAEDYDKFLKENGLDKTATIYGLNRNSPYLGFFHKMKRQDWDKRVQEVEKKYQKKYGLGGEFGKTGFLGSPHETMADLQGIESTLPSGQTILDTDLGQDLFKTKEEKQMYLKASLPGIMKAVEYDPSLWEVAKDRADYAVRVFKDKALANSYATAAAQAFKAFMSGPEANVNYQDPFGDTTK